MIQNKKDYRYYLQCDRIALGIKKPSFSVKMLYYLVPGLTWKFHRRLRKLEYYKNCKKGYISKLYYYYLYYRFRSLSVKLGFSIPENVFGPGLAIVHYGTIVVHKNTKVGKNFRIQAGTNIGASGGTDDAPVIGDNVYVGPGVKIYGGITLGNNIAIAANSCVNKDFTENNVLIGGIPAKIIKKNIDITKIIPCSKRI